jgi:hypothetical protein
MPHESYDETTVYEELRQRTLGLNPIPVLYCFSATAKLNSIIAVDLKDKFQKKQVEFLLDETRMEKYLIKNFPEYMKNDDDISLKAFFAHPYVQTSLLVNEAVGLEAQYSGENVKLVSSSSSRKDRIVALMMGNYFASFLDSKLLRDNDGISDWESMMNVTMVV